MLKLCIILAVRLLPPFFLFLCFVFRDFNLVVWPPPLIFDFYSSPLFSSLFWLLFLFFDFVHRCFPFNIFLPLRFRQILIVIKYLSLCSPCAVLCCALIYLVDTSVLLDQFFFVTCLYLSTRSSSMARSHEENIEVLACLAASRFSTTLVCPWRWSATPDRNRSYSV